jgi:uncharacterized protein YgfB (UPF0149 family)
VTLDPQALHDALHRVRYGPSVAELHGILCGLLVGGARNVRDAWLEPLLQYLDAGNSVAEAPDLRAVRMLHRWTLEGLEDACFGFRMLLPDDDRPLAQRVAALGDWCGGFLLGLGSAAARLDSRLSDDGREMLADLRELSQVSPAVAEDDLEGEGAYAVIVEYARIGVVSLYQELRRGGIGGPEGLRHEQD